MNLGTSDKKNLVLADELPELAAEIRELLTKASESALEESVPTLRIVDRCRCGDDFCATFYTQPKPAGRWGPGHESIPLEPKGGMIIIDVVQGQIACIEILHRDEIRQKLLALLP
jgi:hypothetical protein